MDKQRLSTEALRLISVVLPPTNPNNGHDGFHGQSIGITPHTILLFTPLPLEHFMGETRLHLFVIRSPLLPFLNLINSLAKRDAILDELKLH